MKRFSPHRPNKPNLKAIRWILFSIVFFAFNSFSQTQPIPKWKITDVENYINKTDSILVLNFWATWCKPCVEELPGILKSIKKFNPAKVKLLLVSLDLKKDYPTKIDSFVMANHISGKIVWLDETNANYFCPKIDSSWSGSLPATLIYNGNTKQRKFFESVLSEDKMTVELKAIAASQNSLPHPQGFINDFEKIFNRFQIDTLEAIIESHKKKTDDEIAIVTITNFAPYKNINDFSLNLANSWGLGQKNKNNGVMIVFGSAIRQIRIQNGPGITGRMSDRTTQKIIDENFIPYFRKNEYYNGAKNGLLKIIEVLESASSKKDPTISF